MFRAHINNVDHYIKFTLEEVNDNSLASFDCAGCKEEDRSLEVEVYRTLDRIYFCATLNISWVISKP